MGVTALIVMAVLVLGIIVAVLVTRLLNGSFPTGGRGAGDFGNSYTDTTDPYWVNQQHFQSASVSGDSDSSDAHSSSGHESAGAAIGAEVASMSMDFSPSSNDSGSSSSSDSGGGGGGGGD